jgi:hypothetical protein
MPLGGIKRLIAFALPTTTSCVGDPITGGRYVGLSTDESQRNALSRIVSGAMEESKERKQTKKKEAKKKIKKESP